VFRRRSAGATDGTAQDSPGARSPDAPADEKPARSPAEAAKGRPTPKRSVAEANRRQPIAGSSRSSRASAGPRTTQDKAKARAGRAGKYEAMKRGEAWALNPRDRGPARALARDFVDAKRRISEYYMYVLVVLLAAVFLRNTSAQQIVSPLILVLVVVILADAWLIRRSLTRLMAEQLPGESTRGLTMYSVMRALQIRRFRVPAPRVGPGTKI
jgi:Protein of unknown function (DUF3043)